MLLAALAAVTCTNTDRAPARRSVAPVLASTYDFVVTGVGVDFPEAQARAGFNLDGLYSTSSQTDGCNHDDYLSTASSVFHEGGCLPEQGVCRGGVDNVLPELVDIFEHMTGSPFRGPANQSIQSGHAVVILRVTDVDDLVDDPYVSVRLYHGFAKSSNCAEVFGGSGLFYVDNASLFTSGDLDTPRWWMQGEIVDGKLYVSNASSPFAAASHSIPLLIDLSSSSTLVVGLHQASLYTSAANLTGSTPFAVNFGGWLNTDQFSLKLETIFTNHSWEIFQLMPKLSDLPDPSDSVCDTGAPLAQGGLGVGANVTLSGAVIYGTADTPNSGVCGTSW